MRVDAVVILLAVIAVLLLLMLVGVSCEADARAALGLPDGP